MTNIIYADLAIVRLDPTSDVYRVPARHPLSRQDDYEERFDFSTLFYDVFFSTTPGEVICLGPPFVFNQPQEAIGLQFIALPSGQQCDFSHQRLRRPRPYHRCLLRVRVPDGTQSLAVRFMGRTYVVAIQPNMSSFFAGGNVLVCLSKDNDLDWIVDWVNYHARLHGFRNVLFFDNDSTAYTRQEIGFALAKNCNIENAIVISVPLPYGALTNRKFGGRQDSFFLQSGLYELARYRFLCQASLAANFDIDELLVSRVDEPIAEFVLGIGHPVVFVPRMNAIRRVPSATRARHADVDMLIAGLIKPKWIVQPARLSQDTLIGIHSITNIGTNSITLEKDAAFYIAHTFELTTGWKDSKKWCPDDLVRWASQASFDPFLRRSLDTAFGDAEGPREVETWSPERASSADWLVQQAAEEIKKKNWTTAKALVERALQINPNLPSGFLLSARIAFELGDNRAAEAAFRRFHDLRENNPEFFLLLARYVSLRNRERARSLCLRGLELQPDHEGLRALLVYLDTTQPQPPETA